MSAVRMCDTCGRIFSENEDGWGTGAIQQMKRDRTGAMRPISIQQDVCPEDNPAGQPLEMRPRIDLGGQPAITRGQPGRVGTAAEIARLERELGMGKSTE